MLTFIIGVFVGSTIGIFTIALCNAARQADENSKKLSGKSE